MATRLCSLSQALPALAPWRRGLRTHAPPSPPPRERAYPGAPTSPFTPHLTEAVAHPGTPAPWPLPTYRLLPPAGTPAANGDAGGGGDRDGGSAAATAAKEVGNLLDAPGARALYEGALAAMLRSRALDAVLIAAHRQGRIPFYAAAAGEEGAIIGSALALDAADEVYSQYREGGVLLARGVPYGALVDQCVGCGRDAGKGRQMSIHYQSLAHHFHTVSSTVGTQLLHAAGGAYARTLPPHSPPRHVTAAYFGDGGSSTADFAAAANLAATRPSPLLLLCRNNGWAISTPVSSQWACDGVAGRAGGGYGLSAVRVDGGDVLAVIAAVRAARAAALGEVPLPGGRGGGGSSPAAATAAAADPTDDWAPAAAAAAAPPPPRWGGAAPAPPTRRRWRHCRPVLVEFLTLRAGDHSTSDDASRYRDAPRLAAAAAAADPVARLRGALAAAGWWGGSRDADVDDYAREQRAAVAAAVGAAEVAPPPPAASLFDDVYDVPSPRLAAQRRELLGHLRRHPAAYAGVPVE